MTAVIYRNDKGQEKIYYYKKHTRNLQTDHNMSQKGYKKVMIITINL